MEEEKNIAVVSTASPDSLSGSGVMEETKEISEPNTIPEAEPTAEPEAEKTEPENMAEPTVGYLRYAVKTGMFLLGLFAAIIYAVCVIDGVSELLETGLGKIALGEIYGGADNISIITSTPDRESALSPEKALDLSATPANEHEDKTGETAENPTESAAENGSIGIVTADISTKAINGLDIINETPYSPSLSPDSERAVPPLDELYTAWGEDAPVVLILHTHATESYAESGAFYTTEEQYRSLTPEENILTVGQALADTLTARGINTLFCRELFDAEDFTMAYYNAALKIREYLAEYPSISYIFDLHRDSIPYSDGEQTIRPATVINGKECAQAMFVVGTDYGGSGHTGWTDNFNLACRIQSSVFAEHNSLMRPINLRSASFNEQYTKGSLLIEIGAVGSSLEEACNTAELLGEFIADEIIG